MVLTNRADIAMIKKQNALCFLFYTKKEVQYEKSLFIIS